MRHDLVDGPEGFQLELGAAAKRNFQAMDTHVAERLDGAEAAILKDRFRQLTVKTTVVRRIVLQVWRRRHRLGHVFAEFVEEGVLREGAVRIVDDGLDDVLPVVGEASCDVRLAKRDIAAEIPSGAAVDGMTVFVVEIAAVADDHDLEFDLHILQIVDHELRLAERHFAGDDDAADIELLAEEADGFRGEAADARAEVDGLVDAPRLETEHDGRIRDDVSVRIELLHGLHGGTEIGKPFGAVVMGIDGEIEPATVVMDGFRNFPQIGNLQEIVAMAKRPAVRAYLPAVFGEPISRDESREELLGTVLHVLFDPIGRVVRV